MSRPGDNLVALLEPADADLEVLFEVDAPVEEARDVLPPRGPEEVPGREFTRSP